MSATLHIGFVTETYAPEVNGVAMTLGRLVNGLQSSGHRVTLFRPQQLQDTAPKMNGTFTEHLLPGFTIPIYKELRFGSPARKKLSKEWQIDRPDVIYIATEGPLGWSAAQLAKQVGIPTVSGFHTNFHVYGKYYGLSLLEPLALRYLGALHRKTGCTLVPTGKAAGELRAQGFGQVEVLQRGVDTTLFNPGRRNQKLRSQWGLSDKDIACIHVGRIAAEKNIAEVITTYHRIRSQHDVRLILVGDGPLREKIQRDNPEVIFCGMQHGIKLAEHYASGDVFLFPSLSETFGNVVTEAMASGLAIVAYDEAAAHEHLANGHSGMLVTEGGEPDFATTAARLCAQPEKITELGKNAAEQARSLGWDRIIARFMRILEQQIEEKNP